MAEDVFQKHNLKLPDFESPSEGERWWVKIVNSVQTFPLESARSYLIPGKGELYYFQYRTYWEGEKPPKMGLLARNTTAVFAMITAKLPNLEITKVEEEHKKSLFPGLPLSFKMSKKQHDYDSEVVKVLHSIFPEVTKRYQKGEAGTLGKLYLYLLELTSGKKLMLFYKALNPDFFAWCKRAKDIKKFPVGKAMFQPVKDVQDSQ